MSTLVNYETHDTEKLHRAIQDDAIHPLLERTNTDAVR